MVTMFIDGMAIEFDREADGRWIADVPALPGVTAYGRTREEALAAVTKLAREVIADRRDHGEPTGLCRENASKSKGNLNDDLVR